MSTLTEVPAPRAQPDASPKPLEPGRPRALLGWLRGSRAFLPTWLSVGGMVVVTLALGTWGFSDLRFHSAPHGLTFPQSFYNAIKLYTVNLGPASGGSGSPSPNWQILVAAVLAAALVVRAVFALVRDRLRRLATRYLLRDHVIVCGAGVHGTELVRALSGGRATQDDRRRRVRRATRDPDQPIHDVVLVDIDPGAVGMRASRGKYEWRLVGDCVLERTLMTAGAARASWIVAITGNDYLNSQVASTVLTLVDDGRARERVHMLVQVEDPSLTRFLEEDVELARRKAGTSGLQKLPIVSPFSPNTSAAEALLDGARCADGSPLLELHDGRGPNILLAGDHPLIEVLLLAAVRRWQEETLQDLEVAAKRDGRAAGRSVHPDAKRPPLHISVFGPDAIGRVERLGRHWRPETAVAAIEATDAELSDEAAFEWLREEGRADHAFIVCTEELEGVRLTLGVSRALGPDVLMTRVTAEPGSVLDDDVQFHTERSDHLAATTVEQLAELASDPRALRSLAAPQRLEAALGSTRGELASPDADGDAKRLADRLFLRPEIEIHSDSSWRLPTCERELLQPLLEPVPLSALVRARLVVDLAPPETLRAIGTKLSKTDPAGLGFTAWCLCARQMTADAVRALLNEGDGLRPENLQTRDLPSGEIARMVLRLRADAGDPPPGAPHGPLAERRGRMAILAGGAKGMSRMTADASRALLERALLGYDGTILSGGTAVGLPGVVADVAGPLGIFTIGYAPSGQGPVGDHTLLRETEAGEFSAREPLQMWSDIVDGAVRPAEVRVLVFPGGPITRQEILLALAVGATVAWVDPLSESVEPLENQLPLGAAGVLELPPDAMTVRAFLMPTRLEDSERTIVEPIARASHSASVRSQRVRAALDDPAMAPWDELVFTLKRSTLARAEDIPNKLALVGKRLERGGRPLVLSTDEVELLAEVEHGRWNIERLQSGWTIGERDVARKTTPYLLPWADLAEEIREYDRRAVRNIAPALEEVGWGVVDA